MVSVEMWVADMSLPFGHVQGDQIAAGGFEHHRRGGAAGGNLNFALGRSRTGAYVQSHCERHHTGHHQPVAVGQWYGGGAWQELAIVLGASLAVIDDVEPPAIIED